MKDFHKIIKDLKLYLAKNKKGKVLDKDVANALGISQSKFATIKRRNVTPYVNILEFCKAKDLSANEMFFD